MDDWVLPVIQGTLQIEPCSIEGYEFDFILISRRSRERAGNHIYISRRLYMLIHS
jgi:hypothetical protein